MPHSLKSKVKSLCYKGEITEKERDRIIKALEQTELNPSYKGVKSELKPCEDCISRKEALRHRHIIYDDDGVGYSVVRVDEIEQLPSVTPQQPCEEENPNCTECRYYDKEKHYCPRFCRVIENTMAEITSQQPRWIPVSERLPLCEQEVLICTQRRSIGGKTKSIITSAVYEDGNMRECYSRWHWEDIEYESWDEEEDCGIIPEGWWEYRHYNPDEVYNNLVDDFILAWMPLPTPYAESEDEE